MPSSNRERRVGPMVYLTPANDDEQPVKSHGGGDGGSRVLDTVRGVLTVANVILIAVILLALLVGALIF
jgi:hypothetical protein